METPNTKTTYIKSDKDSVSFVLITFIAWGKKEIEVHKAAVKPIYSVINEHVSD